jgi:methyl-accepting chemotaxis protein
MASQIHHATTEQLTNVHQVLDMTHNITHHIAQKHASSQQVTDTAHELSAQAELLMQTVERFKLETQEERSTLPSEGSSNAEYFGE